MNKALMHQYTTTKCISIFQEQRRVFFFNRAVQECNPKYVD